MNDDIKSVLYDELSKNSRVLVELAEKLSKCEKLDVSILSEMNYSLLNINRDIINIEDKLINIIPERNNKKINISTEESALLVLYYVEGGIRGLLEVLASTFQGWVVNKSDLERCIILNLFYMVLAQEYLILGINRLSSVEKDKYLNEIDKKKHYLNSLVQVEEAVEIIPSVGGAKVLSLVS